MIMKWSRFPTGEKEEKRKACNEKHISKISIDWSCYVLDSVYAGTFRVLG